ncbi:hypothetical protein NSND_50744 [Nitrospira sp. ND1]|nr:hypothetical protein NSND_50744 [Nitrospira sp. ND1]
MIEGGQHEIFSGGHLRRRCQAPGGLSGSTARRRWFSGLICQYGYQSAVIAEHLGNNRSPPKLSSATSFPLNMESLVRI